MKRRFLPMAVLIVLVALYFSFSIISNIIKINEKEKQLQAERKALESQEKTVQKQSDLLESEVDEQYIRQIAKDMLGLVEPDEKIYKVN